MNFVGDILLTTDEDGNWDWDITNGQPLMTKGFETACLLAVFGEKSFYNELVDSDSEKMFSNFPSVIARNVVADSTVNNGVVEIKKALKFMIDENIARAVNVSGQILDAHSIYWQADIERKSGDNIKFRLNWSKGKLTAKFDREGVR